jgi:hypothetical protein
MTIVMTFVMGPTQAHLDLDSSLDIHMFSKGKVAKFRTTILKTYLKKLEQMVELVFHEVVNILHKRSKATSLQCHHLVALHEN